MANNTLYRVGARSHVIEVGFGSRSCDGDRAQCTASLAQGGWGTNVPGREEPIPNRNVVIRDNFVLNPDGYQSQWQQFAVAAPRTPSAGSNIPSPARADDGLQIYGNVIWNGPPGHPLGIEQPGLAADVGARNVINTARPVLGDPARGDYRVVPVDGLPATPVAPSPSPAPQPVPTPPAVPRVPLTAGFRAVAAATARSVTTFVVTFNRAVTGVTLDDFMLVRGRAAVSLAGGRIMTTDGRTYTLANVPRTNFAGAYTLRLRAAGTGIADAWSIGLAAPATVSWRMTRTVRA